MAAITSSLPKEVLESQEGQLAVELEAELQKSLEKYENRIVKAELREEIVKTVQGVLMQPKYKPLLKYFMPDPYPYSVTCSVSEQDPTAMILDFKEVPNDTVH